MSLGNKQGSSNGHMQKIHESEKVNKSNVPFQSMDTEDSCDIPHLNDLVDFLRT